MFLVEEAGADARALGRGDGEAGPLGGRRDPFLVEEAEAAGGGGHEPELAIGSGEHGADGLIEAVFDSCGFIDEEEGDSREASDFFFAGGEADDARVIGQDEGDFVVAVALGRETELEEEGFGFADELAGLSRGGGEGHGEGTGLSAGFVHGFGGSDGGLAPLASAVENATMGVLFKELGLSGVWLDVEEVADEVQGRHGAEVFGGGGHTTGFRAGDLVLER